jgi:hypothetical protein
VAPLRRFMLTEHPSKHEVVFQVCETHVQGVAGLSAARKRTFTGQVFEG